MKTNGLFKHLCLPFVAASLAFSSVAYSADMTSEIQTLNREFNGALGYPIVIIDRPDFNKFLAQHNAANTDNEDLLAVALKAYVDQKHGVKMTIEEASEIASNYVPSNEDASAMPFFTDRVHADKIKYCIVTPSTVNNTPLAEVKRLTGAKDHPELFTNFNFEKAAGLMSQEESQLFSLYHELSHCLDRNYLSTMNEFEVDPHNVHLMESFAEVNALFLLSQRKDLNKLGAPRSILRSLYSKYYGPSLAQSGPAFFSANAANTVNKAGGTVYFLAGVLMSAQQQINDSPARIKSMSLEETLALSKTIAEQHAFDKMSFDAMNMMMADGMEDTIAHYQKLADKKPSLFLRPYQTLLYVKSVFDSLGKMYESKTEIKMDNKN